MNTAGTGAAPSDTGSSRGTESTRDAGSSRGTESTRDAGSSRVEPVPDAGPSRAAPVLVLWDLDLTLLDPAGFGARMIAPALADVLGREPVMDVAFAGRTDRAILTELLVRNAAIESDDDAAYTDLASTTESSWLVNSVMDAVAERCERFADDLLTGGGGPLPGARDAVRALAANPQVHQGIVTGNMRRTALLKLRVCGFDGVPDPTLGAFGDLRSDRADLILDAVDAARAQGIESSVARAVVIGDHIHDVRGALDAGARCVAVATGRVCADELHSAGAHVVLPDLTDTDALVNALCTAVASPHSAPRRP